MFRKSVAAAVLVAGAVFVPVAAQAASGYTVNSTELRAGPDEDYPIIRDISGDRRVDIYGCLNDWSYCDVGYRSDRGWIDGRDIAVDYRSRRTTIVDAGPYVGIGFLSFSFGSYWDNYYRGRPFYRERGRWERHYNDHYRPNWGPRPGWRDNDHRDGRNWNDRDKNNNGRPDGRDWNDRNRHDNNGRDNNRNDNNRNDNNRNDNDRRDNDNRTTYRGAPNPPAVAPVQPTPRPGMNGGDRRPGDDNRRGGDDNRRDSVSQPKPMPTPAPQIAPKPQVAPTPPAMGNDRPGRNGMGERGDRPSREGMGGDRQGREGAGAKEGPRQTPAQQRGNDEPKPKRAPPTNPDDQDNRPGR